MYANVSEKILLMIQEDLKLLIISTRGKTYPIPRLSETHHEKAPNAKTN